ncbi:MAG: permease-like cell division protein FtsX [Lentimicrobiaceae bacterium]|nr:permease-like cell division protein FtsX [Lentimicrobiaceae bacterium]
MNTNENTYTQRQITGSYFISVISIMLVLFMLGLFSVLLVHAQILSNHIKENIGFEIIINKGVKEAGIVKLQKTLDATPYVKSTEYISQEETIKRLSNDLGEDFVKWLGDEENPLLPSIDVRFKAAWANNDSLAKIEQQILMNTDVKEVYYQKSLVHLINQNVRRIGIVLLGMSSLLLVIALALINNTIRLSVYAKRLLIRSMQLVGATKTFIRKPFIISGILQGLIGALLAVGMLSGVLYILVKNIPELMLLHNTETLLIIYVSVIVLGMLLTGICTYFSLNKYLRMDTNKLHI